LQIQPNSNARIYIASPGGSVVYDGTSGANIGDNFGLSAWIDYSKSVRYQGYSLSPVQNESQPAAVQTVRLALGTGFWSSTFFLASAFWGIPEGTTPVARVLVVGADVLKVEGRKGRVLFDDPWLGSVTDWTKNDDAGWTVAKEVPARDRPAGTLIALQVPYASTNSQAEQKMPAIVEVVTPLGSTGSGSTRWLYKFSRNIVGHAVVAAGAVSASTVGNLTLLHCENINSTLGINRSSCVHLGQRGKHTHPADTHILPAGFGHGNANVELAGSFSYHGFQYVIVEADIGVHFQPASASLSARWIVSKLEESATISFGGAGAELLGKIRDIVKASQLGNLAAYVPTDCPTREKHGG
jgi:hypothetical protein